MPVIQDTPMLHLRLTDNYRNPTPDPKTNPNPNPDPNHNPNAITAAILT